jgi:redox-sensitive bicupin YhaK (pirin superfamily)
MSLTIRRAEERGHADHGWLDTYHTFSFADYHDRDHMGFRSLRVINDDRIQPGRGFGPHPHRDMEIFSYLLEGALQHQDSLGNGRVLRPGQIQLMSAGRGVIHSEHNPSSSEVGHLLQIWIQPRERGLKPGYTEWTPQPGREHEPKVLVISPDGRDDSAVIHQDAEVYRLRLAPGDRVQHELRAGRGLWLQIARGELKVSSEADREEQQLFSGDGLRTESPGTVSFTAVQPTEALLFDLA